MEQQQFERWYDRYPNIRAIFELSYHCPPAFQENLGQQLVEAIQQYQSVLHPLKFKNLGHTAVLGLYKCQNRQRWYDAVPSLHQAFKMLLVLPEPVLAHLDERCAIWVPHIHSQRIIGMSQPQAMDFSALAAMLPSGEADAPAPEIEIKKQSVHIRRSNSR